MKLFSGIFVSCLQMKQLFFSRLHIKSIRVEIPLCVRITVVDRERTILTMMAALKSFDL